jgi:hypothetical protein
MTFHLIHPLLAPLKGFHLAYQALQTAFFFELLQTTLDLLKVVSSTKLSLGNTPRVAHSGG